MTFTASLQPIKPVSPALWHTPNKNRNCKSFTTTHRMNSHSCLYVHVTEQHDLRNIKSSYSSTGSSYNVFRLKSLLPRGMGFSVSHTCDLCEPGRQVPNLNMRNELKSSTRPLGSITVVTQPLESHGKDITQPGISNPQKLTSHCLCCNPQAFLRVTHPDGTASTRTPLNWEDLSCWITCTPLSFIKEVLCVLPGNLPRWSRISLWSRPRCSLR